MSSNIKYKLANPNILRINYSNNSGIWDYLKIVTCVTFISFCALYFIPRNYDYAILYWQILSIISTIVFIFGGFKLNIKQNFCLIFFFQLIFSVSLFIYFFNFSETTFGYDAVDALLYQNIATNTYDGSWAEFLNEMNNRELKIPDYGFPVFLKYFYSLSPDIKYTNFFLIIINCVSQTFTCYYTYKICRLLQLPKLESKWIIILWGYNFCSVYLNVAGLKEPIFVLLCILTTYYMIKLKSDHNVSSLLGCTLFMAFTWFFRNYMTAFFILTFIGYIILPKLYNKLFPLLIITILISSIALQNLMVLIFPEIYYAIMNVEEKIPGGLMRIVYYCIAFFGPIPRFFNDKYPIVLMISSYCLIKYFFSIFAVWGSYKMIKYKETKFYPLILLCLFTIVMLIVSGHFTEFRYFYPIAPLFFILIVSGFKYCKNNLKFSYLTIATLIMLAFDVRG